MNVLLIDATQSFLDFAIRCAREGHTVRWFVGPLKNGDPSEVGRGFDEFERVPDFKPHLRWADLIMCSDNVKYLQDLVVWRKRGFPILAPSPEAADLELRRDKGQESFKKAGLDVMPSTEFTDYDSAIEFVKKNMKRYVSKPDGDADKALSYVSKSPQDMVAMLMRWKKNQKGKRSFILQEFVPGIEMAVGGWFGSHGFNDCVLENFEFKKLMNGDLGCNCYSEDTEVLTGRGWLRFNDVTLQDKVASFDPREQRMFFERPSALHWTRYDGEMVQFKNRYVDLLVTPSHQMWGKWRKSEVWKFCDAEKTPSEYTVMQAAPCEGIELEAFTVPRGTQAKFGPKRKDFPVNGDDWMRFLGLYLSEGHHSYGKVHISQEPGKKKQQMGEWLAPFGARSQKHGWVIHSSPLVEYVKQFGVSRDKFVPDCVKSASIRQINLFLDAFLLGDGDIHDGRRRFHSGSWRLISDIQELLQRIGRTGVICTDKRTSMVNPLNGETYTANPVYSIEESTRTKAIVRGKSFVEYHGMIGCVTLPTTHLLFVRRNGRVSVCGNTGEQGTAIKYVKKSQSKLFKETLAKVEQQLHGLDYKGFVDISVIVDGEGNARPLEYTMRPGWPLFNIQQSLHREPVTFLKALAEGKDEFDPYTDHALGVVLTIPDYPYSHLTHKEVIGYPIYFLDDDNPFRAELHPCELMKGEAPTEKGGKIVMREQFLSAGDYLLVTTGIGKSVREAKDWAYKAAESVEIPNSVGYRTDIGLRLKKRLPMLQEQGYATAWEW